MSEADSQASGRDGKSCAWSKGESGQVRTTRRRRRGGGGGEEEGTVSDRGNLVQERLRVVIERLRLRLTGEGARWPKSSCESSWMHPVR